MEKTNEMQGYDMGLAALPKNEIVSAFQSASKLTITKDEQRDLIKIFDDDIVQIRPDGHIYIPQSYYRERLNETLGIGQWALVPIGSHQEVGEKSTKVFVNGILVIRGCYVGQAVGESEYFHSNANQSMASAWEAAKSDCITRCCKDLSIGRQIYQSAFVREWQTKYAISVWVSDQNKPQWRRASAEPFLKETGPVKTKDSNGFSAPVSNPQDLKPWLNKTAKNGSLKGGYEEVETDEWKAIIEDLCMGRTTFAILEAKYKIRKDLRAELLAVKIDWVKLLAGCETGEQVDQLALLHKEAIEADPRLRNAFTGRKAQLRGKVKEPESADKW